MINYRSPVVNNNIYPPGYNNYLAVGQQGYNYQNLQNPYQNGYQGYYGYNYINPYEQQRIKQEQERIAYEKRKKDLSLLKNLSRNSQKYLGKEIDEELLDKVYDPEYKPELEKRVLPKFTVVATKGDKPVAKKETSYINNKTVNSSSILQSTELGENVTHNYQYINELNKIKSDHDLAVKEDSDLVEFFNNSYKLYIQALQNEAIHKQRQLGGLYDQNSFRNTLYRNSQSEFANMFRSTNLDDNTITLPDKLKNEYTARKQAFLQAALRRGGE